MGLGLVGLSFFKHSWRTMHWKLGAFSSLLWYLLVTMLFGWWILLPPRVFWDIIGYESEPLSSYSKLRNFSYSVKLITPFLDYSSGSFIVSWSHQRTVHIVPGILSASVQNAFTGRKTTLFAMVLCRLFMYNLMRWIRTDSIDSSTARYSNSQTYPHFAVIPVIRRATRWWNSIRTLSISLFTTRLFLP